jgi:hypothetical protein
VDAKVAATLATDASARADWLAAAHTVTSGAGDRSSASELVDQQVRPFVDGVIAAQWVSAMRAGTEAVDAAYRRAANHIQAVTGVAFELPGHFEVVTARTRSAEPVPDSEPVLAAVTPAAAAVSPAAAAVTPAAAAVGPPAAPPGPAAPAVTDPIGAEPVSPPLPSDPGGGMPGLGSGMGPGLGSALPGTSGFGQQLSDLLSGLLGSGAGDIGSDPTDLGDENAPDDGDLEEDADEEDPGVDEEEGEEGEKGEESEESEDGEVAADPPAEQPPTGIAATENPVVPDESAPAPTPVPEAFAVPPVDVAAAPPPERTPCEIAADELPQIGG